MLSSLLIRLRAVIVAALPARPRLRGRYLRPEAHSFRFWAAATAAAIGRRRLLLPGSLLRRGHLLRRRRRLRLRTGSASRASRARLVQAREPLSCA